ncbi:chromosome condensation protein [Diplodia corticola]|uniref:Chromosome condensation protein n=1 Tax=Diplodia corticola TaxID=236234 RepID=A0A1J9RF88_9PEZI|nr:chromosome condensation protein [Diplodia corticola]OJD31227.1 chromosome condensation protein [Diplodia corticola]
MEESSAAAIARGPHKSRSSCFDEQRALQQSPRSRPSSPSGADGRNRFAERSQAGRANPSAADAAVVGTVRSSSLTPLQAAAARGHDGAADADAARAKHRRDTSNTTKRSQHPNSTSGGTPVSRQTKQSSRDRSNAAGKSPRSKHSNASRQTTPEKPPKTPKRQFVHEYTLPTEYDYLNDAAAPSPVIGRGNQRRLWQSPSIEEEFGPPSRGIFEHEDNLSELSAVPPVVPKSRDRTPKSRHNRPSGHRQDSQGGSYGSSSSGNITRPPTKSTAAPQPRRASRFATQLYTVSYLILFAILGTLARLGVQWLTFYPGAPVIFSELWANVGGSLILGFLAEDRNLFRAEWGTPAFFPATKSRGGDEEMAKMLSEAKAAHGRVKKTIPLYIGLATGFCGSFTSYSSFMRDVFLALSNDLPAPFNHPTPPGATRPGYSTTVSRNGGYSFMAVVAVVATTVGLCLSAYTFGAHLALALESITPTLPFRFTRRVLDRAVVPIAWLAWLGAIFMAIWPPDRPMGAAAGSSSGSSGSWADETWRGQALFACVFAPPGCLLRFYASIKLNGFIPSFPLGTFAVNVFGTAVLGMAFDLQHVPLDSSNSGGGGGGGGVAMTSMVGGGRLGCQVLEGVMDGFCGCLTTVSTWVAELRTLARLRQAYAYGIASVAVGLAVLVVVVGSVRWTIGFSAVACATTRWG